VSGDSGGPLFVDFGTPAGAVLAGVHSGGLGAACDGSDNAFDTDVFVENAWLRAQSGVDFDQTACGDGAQVGDASVSSQSASGLANQTALEGVVVPAGTKLLRVGLTGDFNGDFDLYVNPGAPATTGAPCVSAHTDSFEFCEVADPTPGQWYATLPLSGGPSNFQLSATTFPENPAPPPIGAGDFVVSNFTGFELTQVNVATGDRVAMSSSLRGTGPAFASPEGIARAADGSILVANPFVPNVLRVDPASGNRTVVSGCTDTICSTNVGTGPPLLQPRFVAIAAGGRVIVADRTVAGTYAIVSVDPANGNRTVLSGCLDSGCSTIVGTGPAIGRLFGVAIEADGHIVAADGLAVFRIDPATGNRTLLSGCPDATCTTPIGSGPAFGQPVDIAVEPSGALVVTYQIEDSIFGALRRIDPATGARTLVSGCTDVACSSFAGAGPTFANPFGIVRDRDGSLLVADTTLEAVLRVDATTGNRTLVSGCADTSCSSALGSGGQFGQASGIALAPEPASWADALAAAVALALVPRRRQSTRFTAGGDHAPETASPFGQ
jgi:sugar lactone lactonase YvrE